MVASKKQHHELQSQSSETVNSSVNRFTYEIVVYNKAVRDNLREPIPKKIRWSEEWADNQYFIIRDTTLREHEVRRLIRSRFPEHQGFVIVEIYILKESE